MTIALLVLVSASHAEKEDDSMEENDYDSFYDSQGKFIHVSVSIYIATFVPRLEKISQHFHENNDSALIFRASAGFIDSTLYFQTTSSKTHTMD